MLKNVSFETSVFTTDKIIQTDKKQFVLVGKSNVGKSSFINAISNRKHLAKVGQTPGKTRSLNYYNVNDEYYIVDLPGFGYSKMSQKEKLSTSKLVNRYLSSGMATYVFFLVDIRHKPTNDDKLMYDYLVACDIPFCIIANKSDKVAKTKVKDYTDVIIKSLFAKEEIIPFSSQNKLNLELILEKFNMYERL